MVVRGHPRAQLRRQQVHVGPVEQRVLEEIVFHALLDRRHAAAVAVSIHQAGQELHLGRAVEGSRGVAVVRHDEVGLSVSRSQGARENRRDFWAALRIRLDVDASYNSADYASADDAADASLGYYKEDHAADLVILKYERTTLRKVPASRCVIQFQDAKSGETTIVEEVIAIRAEDGIVFSIGLTTTPARYSEDRRVLKQILKGVRFTKPD